MGEFAAVSCPVLLSAAAHLLFTYHIDQCFAVDAKGAVLFDACKFQSHQGFILSGRGNFGAGGDGAGENAARAESLRVALGAVAGADVPGLECLRRCFVGEDRHVDGVGEEHAGHEDEHLVEVPAAERPGVIEQDGEEGQVHAVPDRVHADPERAFRSAARCDP